MTFSLKGSLTDVKKRVSIFQKLEDPSEIINETTSRAKFIIKGINRFYQEYELLLKQVEQTESEGNLLIFTYPSTRNSYTSELSNEVYYRNQDKVVLIGREKNGEIKFSIRSAKINIAKILENALVNVKGYGGGHAHAVGGCVSQDDFDLFLENLKNQI